MDWCFYELLENIIPFEKSRLFLCPAKTIVVLVNDSQGMVTIGSSSLVGEFELRRD